MKARICSALAVLVLMAAAAFPQQQMDEKQMMEMMAKLASPGPGHKVLEPFVGTWDATVRMWMAPGAPPTESKGVSENRWILGGRYLEQRFRSTFMDQPFEGIGYTAYDNVKKQYIGTWMDTMSTGIMLSAGVADATGNVMVASATMSDPMTGQDSRMDERVTIIDNDRHLMEMYSPGPDGKMFKMMEIEYVRRK